MGVKDWLFGKKKGKNQVNICLPDESFVLAEVRSKDGVELHLMIINKSLGDYKEDVQLKRVFGYYCSIIFEYEDVDENQWPSSEEFAVMQNFTDEFDKALKNDAVHPNALFVARVTSNDGTCQMIWMLNNPDLAINYLDDLIAKGNQTREFEYRIEKDPTWDSIDYFLEGYKNNNK